MSEPVRTVELGQFEDDNAETIAQRLDDAGIVWWSKTAGRFARTLFAGDWGTRLFVEHGRLQQARTIARDVLEP